MKGKIMNLKDKYLAIEAAERNGLDVDDMTDALAIEVEEIFLRKGYDVRPEYMTDEGVMVRFYNKDDTHYDEFMTWEEIQHSLN